MVADDRLSQDKGQFQSRQMNSRMTNSISLPQLPPLDTCGLFDKNVKAEDDNISIGWTPVSAVEATSKSKKLESTSHSVRSKRPPPPPISSQFSLPSSPTQIAPNRNSPILNDKIRSINKRSTIAEFENVEEKLYSLKLSGTENAHLRISSRYRNAFIGEAPGSEVNERSTSTNLESNFLESRESFSQVDDIIKSYSVPFEKPLAPRDPSSRNASGTSRISDGVESNYSDSNYTFNNSNAKYGSFSSILGGRQLEVAPSITTPSQPFSIASLDENKLYQCYSVHKLSDIYEWILKVYFEWFNECVFGKLDFFQMIQLLLEFQMPKSFDQDTIDSNVDKVIESLVLQKAVRFEQDILYGENETGTQEITIIVAGLDISGIFTELLPCYSLSETNYSQNSGTCCYSYTCTTRLDTDSRKEIKLSDFINKSVGLWTDYWKLTPEMLAEINPKEIQRQSFIFDLILLEERSLNMANAAIEIYGKNFYADLLPDEPNFSQYAFSIFEPLIQLHTEYLMTPIFMKLKTKGKFIDGIGKIYLKWCNEAKEIYLNYATAMATVHEIITWEKQHNTPFAQWLNEIDTLPETNRSKIYHDVIFFGGFFKSLQNLPLTLQSILKNTDPSMEDYEFLQLVIQEVINLNSEVDRVHGEAVDRRALYRFSTQLVFDSSALTISYVNLKGDDSKNGTEVVHDKLDLGLTDPNRRLILIGTALKKRDLWLEPTPVHIALLDNYFLVTENVVKEGQEHFKLIERPIPIEYLNIEQRRNEILTTPTTPKSLVYRGTNKSATQLVAEQINVVRPHLKIAATTVSKSLISPQTATSQKAFGTTQISNENATLAEYSFKVRNLATNESFTFVVNSYEEREKWLTAFISRFRQKSNLTSTQLFKLNVVTTQFAYSEKDAPINLPVAPDGSEIDEALKEFDAKGMDLSLQSITPMTIFCCSTLYHENGKYLLLACELGVYMRCEDEDDNIFIKVLNCTHVHKLEVNIKLGLLFVLDNKRLCYYNIPSLFGAYFAPEKYLPNNRIVGILIKDKVNTFKIAEDFGHSKQLLYERKNKIVVLTPEFDRLTKAFKFYKFYKEFFLPAPMAGLSSIEVYNIDVFKKCIIISTSKGFILYHESFNDEGIILPTFTNDKEMYDYTKQSHLNSALTKSNVETMAKKDSSKLKMVEYVIRDIATKKTRPVACFKNPGTSDILMVYEMAIVKINNVGHVLDYSNDVLVLDFTCTGISLVEGNLIVAGDNLLQIYNLNNSVPLGKQIPAQVIKGKKVRLINSAFSDQPIFTLSHPHIPNRQLVLSCNLLSK